MPGAAECAMLGESGRGARALRHLRADDDDVLIEPIRQRMRELCGDRLGVADVPGETSDGER